MNAHTDLGLHRPHVTEDTFSKARPIYRVCVISNQPDLVIVSTGVGLHCSHTHTLQQNLDVYGASILQTARLDVRYNVSSLR